MSGASGTGQQGGSGSEQGGAGGGDAGAGGEAGKSTGSYVQVEVHDAACALTDAGDVVCWGADLPGVSRGNGGFSRVALARTGGCGLKAVDGKTACFRLLTNSFAPAPIPLGGTAPYSEIAMAGSGLICGLASDTGALLCQGDAGPESPLDGAFAQFSLGYDSASSAYSACAITRAGEVVCFAWDTDVVLTLTPAGAFRRVSAGGRHACAIDSMSSIVCWGSDELGRASPPSGVFESVSSGESHTCALRPTGVAECWGDNSHGQSTPPPDVTFAQLSAGRAATCGVTTSGWLRCWGDTSAWSALPPEG